LVSAIISTAPRYLTKFSTLSS